jgi:hypothetical protein
MKSYTLNIAGYNIRFESSPDGHELVPSERFLRNIAIDSASDININVHSGTYDLPSDAVRVFHAPYVEEIDGIRVQHRTNFWSVWKHSSDLYIRTIFPLSSSEKNGVLKFSLTTREWDLWIDSGVKEIDPFEYPLDGLILYYLTVINGDIMIHSSGVNYSGKGYLFTGVSGKGKSTMANLWENAGAIVIHDDRLIIRKSSSGFKMYNTPVYKNDEPRESPLDKVFIIEHGYENRIVPVRGAVAVSLVMANCIQHNWGHGNIAGLMDSLAGLFDTIPAYRLSFLPDNTVIDHILENEGKN